MSFILSILLFFSHSATVEVLDPCTGEIRFSKAVDKTVGMNVGQVTMKVLVDTKVLHQATENAVISIFETPAGSDAFVVLNKQEMRAYGWCYTLNGQELAVYPNEAVIANESDHIQWFYGFAFYQSGEWKTMCEKAWKYPFPNFCEN